MQRLAYISIIVLVVIACKRERQPVKSEDRKQDTISGSTYKFSALSKYDTIFKPNAPKRITRNVKLDHKGGLLIAAYDDIIRYDGNSFFPLKKQAGMESWYAFDVLEDKKGNIWIASDQSGVFRIDGQSGAIVNFSKEDGLGHRRNMCIYEDHSGVIWVGGQGGLSRFEGNGFANYSKEDGLPHNDINTVMEDKEGNLWIGTRGNAAIYDGSTFAEIKNAAGKSFFNVWSIIEDRTGSIWLVDSSGLWNYRDDTFIHQLSDVWKIYEDSKGDFWFTGMLVGGASVLKRIKGKTILTEEYDVTEIFTSNKMLFGVLEDKTGSLWIGGGDGIWKFNGETLDYYTGIRRNLE